MLHVPLSLNLPLMTVLELIKEVWLTLGGRELMGTNERGPALCVTSWQLLAAAESL